MAFLKKHAKLKKQKSIYSSQHAKFSFKKFFKRTKSTCFALIVLGVIGSVFYTFKSLEHKIVSIFSDSSESENITHIDQIPKDIDIEIGFVEQDNNHKLSNQEKEFIRNKIEELDLNGLNFSKVLKQVAHKLKIALNTKNIHILKTSFNSYLVSVEKLVPILSIELGKNKSFLISEDCHVYEDNLDTPNSFPKVQDIVISNTQIQSDGYLFLTQEEFGLIDNAVNLYKELQANKVEVDYIKYIKHRGFSFKMKDSQTNVIVGNNLFKEKLSKLQSVIKKLSATKVATVVELDYNNKAFVTEKSL